MKNHKAAFYMADNDMMNATLLHSFFDHLPGMAFQIQLEPNSALHFNYVSPGSSAVLDISPLELEQRPHLLLDSIHPEDRAMFLDGIRQAILNTSPWNWEGRIVLPTSAEVKWVNLRATCRKDSERGTTLEGFMVNITQNKQDEIEIKQAHQQLHELSAYIENFKEEERGRIAREIHDDIGMPLIVLRMDLAWLTQRLPRDNPALQEKTRAMANLLDTAGDTVNSLTHSLRPGFLDCFGIVAALEIEAKEFSKRTGVSSTIIQPQDSLALSDEQSTTLFRIFREILNNISERSGARQVKIQVRKEEQCVHLVVSDDGKRFDEASHNQLHSLGLRVIQQRISHLGGCAKVTSDINQGTEITVCLPLEPGTCHHCTKFQRSLF